MIFKYNPSKDTARDLSEKIRPLEWKPEHNIAFKNDLKLSSDITQNKHFDQNLDTPVVCNTSKSGLGAALDHFYPESWEAIAYVSRFLNSLEEKYSVNELELLGVAWAIEHFKYDLYGKNFTFITENQALISASNASKKSKTAKAG